MYPHKLTVLLTTILFSCCFELSVFAQQMPPKGGRIAVVVDERLSALRLSPDFSGGLIRRVGRGRFVTIRGSRRNPDGIVFYRVSVSTRTQGWMQREAVVSAIQRDDDKRLLTLILNSTEFDRITRARIFLDLFARSSLRPRVLLLFGEAAEEAAARLTRDAVRRLGALDFTHYLNYVGLDRYNRQGIRFTFDRATKRFHYDGAAWKELIRRYPGSIEATTARQRLANPKPTDE
ncbi:MAG TPA: hypothetical protein VLA93_21135 [Pyrinomonadaceae bacterium]|nr:hypothetical protein [Pyrinomonadaceae bacterium]